MNGGWLWKADSCEEGGLQDENRLTEDGFLFKYSNGAD